MIEGLHNILKQAQITDYSYFQNKFSKVLNKHAPLKKKILRYNNNPFMTKNLRKAIITRSKSKSLYNKKRTKQNWDNYKKKNSCVNLLRKTKREYFRNLNIKDISSTKKLRKTIKPFLSYKRLNLEATTGGVL